MILISEIGSIVLSIFAVLVAGVLIFLLIRSIRRQEFKLREEASVLVDTMITRQAMRESVNTYAAKVGTFGSFTLFYIKIDEFENLKELLGGDPVNDTVRDIAERLVRMFKGAANIAHFDDDTFLIFDKKEYNYEDLEETSERLLELVSESNSVLRNNAMSMTASIGVAIYPTCGVTFKELFSNLELATYIANREGGNKYIIYYNELREEESGNLEYFNEVREAMNKGELALYYQPIIDIKNKNIYGFEALIRWEHPVHGIIPPSKFIPILEQSGDITFLAKWSLEQVIRLQQEIARTYPGRDIKITINMSVKQMMEEGMAEEFKRTIHKYGADPHRIILEVAQYAMFEKMNAVRVNLLRLRDTGFLISTDGLGLDYSSITQIENKPIDVLKLDRAFLNDIEDNSMQERYVSMLVDSSERAHRTVICEGVEDFDRLHYVKKQNINIAQGYYISKPFAQSNILDYIHSEDWVKKIDFDMTNEKDQIEAEAMQATFDQSVPEVPTVSQEEMLKEIKDTKDSIKEEPTKEENISSDSDDGNETTENK